MCALVAIGTRVLKDAPVRALEAAAWCLFCTLGTPPFHGLFHRLYSFQLLSVCRDQDDGVVSVSRDQDDGVVSVSGDQMAVCCL